MPARHTLYGLLPVATLAIALAPSALAVFQVGPVQAPAVLIPEEPGTVVAAASIPCQDAALAGHPESTALRVRSSAWTNYTTVKASPPATASVDKSPCVTDPAGTLRWNQTFGLTDDGGTPGGVPIRVTVEMELLDAVAYGGHGTANTTTTAKWRPRVEATARVQPVSPGVVSVVLNVQNHGNAAAWLDIEVADSAALAAQGVSAAPPQHSLVRWQPISSSTVVAFDVRMPSDLSVDLRLWLHYTSPYDVGEHLPAAPLVVHIGLSPQPVEAPWSGVALMGVLLVATARARRK
ncbi:MAG: hypothetical protein ABR562_00390 [Thermoplasmatota archaeon]|nr:hypothetical protein [Halobacteriales archaeon]